MTKTRERSLQEQFIKNPNKVLKGAKFVTMEFPLFSASKMLMRDTEEGSIYGKILGSDHVIGKIDLIFTYQGVKYLVEVKIRKGDKYCFWESLKILGYAVYYKWQTSDNMSVKSAIIIPLEQMKLEHQIVANKLRVKIFLAYLEKGEYKLQLLDERPYWQQILKKS